MKAFLQRAYPHVPVFVQNLGISAYGYLYKRERFGPAFGLTVAEFQDRDRWDAGRMKAYIDTTVRDVLKRAHTAPFYRESWARAGVHARHLDDIGADTLHRLPILKKEDLRRDPLAFVAVSGPSSRLLSYFSSGSTGTPIRAICTATGQQRFAGAREVRSYGWAGTSIRKPRAMIGGQPIVPSTAPREPYYRYNFAERQVYLSAYHISSDTVRNYVEGFNRYRPECVTGYAFSQFEVARLMLEQGLKFDVTPRAAITSSEALTAPMREAVLRAWGCRAYEEYGSVENCVLATECEEGSLHVHPDFGIVEIVDDAGYPVGPGVEGRLVCTALLNDAQYLVRYEIGDTAAWSSTPCACGRQHLPVLSGIAGRVEDVVVSPDGRQLVRFHGIFINVPHLLQGQVVQESLDRFTVRVVSEDGFGMAEEGEVRKRLTDRLGPVSVTVERVTALERSARGKVRAVISRLPRPAADAIAPNVTNF